MLPPVERRLSGREPTLPECGFKARKEGRTGNRPAATGPTSTPTRGGECATPKHPCSAAGRPS
eukprot:15224156-Alexandrium_andersonii.AAC.1